MEIDLDKLKVYTPILSDDDKGVFAVSLVEEPCFETDFIYYGNDKNYQIVNEERREVMGAIIIANKPVLRNDPPIGYHYMLFTPDIIRELRDKYFRDNHISDTNIHHKTDVEGVYLIESVIKDSRYNIHAFNDMPDGTWIGTFKVEDDDVWEGIKRGEMKGFSMEIEHSYTRLDNINNITDFKLNQNFMKENKHLKQIRRKEVLRKAGKKYAKVGMYESVITDKGELTVDGEFRDGATGAVLFNPDAEPAPDGVYNELNDAGETVKVIVIEDTEVVSYRNPDDSEDYDIPVDEIEDLADEKTEDIIEKVVEILKPELEDIIDIVNSNDNYQKTQIEELKKANYEMSQELKQLRSQIKKPLAVQEEKSTSYTAPKEGVTGNDKFMDAFTSKK